MLAKVFPNFIFIPVSTRTNPQKERPALVLYCSSSAWGGLEQMVARLGDWLLRDGIRVCILCVEDSPLYLEAMRLGIGMAWPIQRKYFDFISAIKLAYTMKTWGYPPLLISHNNDLDLGAWAHRFAGGGFDLWYWQHMRLGIPKKGIFQQMRQKRLIGWLTALPYLRDEVLAKTVVPSERIHLVPPGIDVAQFAPLATSKAELRQSLNLPVDVFLVGIVGRLDPQKGQAFIIVALTTLPATIHLAMMGESTKNEHGPNYGEVLLNQANQLGVELRVHLIPFRNETAAFYQAVDCIIMATDGETYGLVTVEALASGTPVLGSHSGGTVDLLGNGEFGYLYKPGNQADMCGQLLYIQAHTEEARGKASAGLSSIVKERSKEVLVSRFKAIVLGR
jgi:glycosyltransferase involved in cell wall biosynthesis